MDCPEPRPVLPPERGVVVAYPEVGGLHHHYDWMAACFMVMTGLPSRLLCIRGNDR
jgi:hypothetical protein